MHGLEGRPSAASDDGARPVHYGPQWALLRFSQPVTAPKVAAAVPAEKCRTEHWVCILSMPPCVHRPCWAGLNCRNVFLHDMGSLGTTP